MLEREVSDFLDGIPGNDDFKTVWDTYQGARLDIIDRNIAAYFFGMGYICAAKDANEEIGK
jgi:hypothetical protein